MVAPAGFGLASGAVVLPGVAVEGAVGAGEAVDGTVVPVAGAVPIVAPVFAPTALGVLAPAPPPTVRLSTTVRLPENDSAIRRAISLSRAVGTDPESCTACSVTFTMMFEFVRFGSFL